MNNTISSTPHLEPERMGRLEWGPANNCVRHRHLVNLCSISARRRRCADSTDREPNVNHEWNSLTSVTRKMRKTHEPRIHLCQGFGVTGCPDVTDRLFDKRKEANVFRKQVRSGPCFLRGLLSEENPPTARWAVAPCHSLLSYFCIRDLWGYSYFGARDATIFSKQGSPRSGSQNGSSFNSP